MNPRIRALIVDDEPRARSRMRRLLQPHDDVVVIGEASNGQEALQQVLTTRPDVVFLDIQMPGTTGTELAERLREYLPESVRPLLVFTTAHAEHAVEAFGLESLDYLLKPVERERLASTLRRIRRAVWTSGRATTAPSPAPSAPSTLTGHHGASIEAIAVGSIEYIEVVDGVVFATTDDGEQHRLSQSLGEVEARLPSPMFTRASRSVLVNTERIERLLSEGGSWYAVLDSTQRVKLSRRRTRVLRELLQIP